MIKKKYNQLTSQNSSINSVIKCLFSFQSFKNRLLKHRQDFSQQSKKVISNSLLFALDNMNNNWSEQLKLLRDVLTFNNSCFIDPGEIEPTDLIEYIIKKLHTENNKRGNPYSRLYTYDNDSDIYNREAILKKFYANFPNYFKSFISDMFFGIF